MDSANKTAATDSGTVTIFANSRKNRASPPQLSRALTYPLGGLDGELVSFLFGGIGGSGNG